MKSPAPALTIEGFEIIAADDGKPRTRDVDLGKRLGYDRPRKPRGIDVRATAART